ncbi:MAG: hypothetical protein JNM80_05565 [Phycisphaerae bacterium]|nr:hypothetical protein [Phycisphaerae bacterium]
MTDRPVYLIRQTLDQTHQEEIASQPLRDAGTREALLLIESTQDATRWRRTFCEYELPPGQLDQIRGTPTIPRAALAAEHKALAKARPIPAGFPFPCIVDASPANDDPHLSAGIGNIGHQPIPFHFLHAPTILPIARPADAKPDATGFAYRAAMSLGVVAAGFPLAYRVAESAPNPAHRLAAITLDEAPRSTPVGDATLTLSPSGSLKVMWSTDPLLPISGRGVITLSVRVTASYKGRPVDVVALKSRNAFEFFRVPASFDDTRLMLGAWTAEVPLPPLP